MRICAYTRIQIQRTLTLLLIGSSISASVSQHVRPRRARGIYVASPRRDDTIFLAIRRIETLAREIRYTSERFCRSESRISASSTDRNSRSFGRIVLRGANRPIEVTGERSSARARDEKTSRSRKKEILRPSTRSPRERNRFCFSRKVKETDNLRDRSNLRQKRGARSRTRLNRVNSDVNYQRKSDHAAAPARRGGALNMQRAVK